MNKLYLAYGSNLSVSQMAFRCPDAKIIGTGKIKDYKLVFRFHADIEPCIGSEVPVLVWQISKADEKRLDRYEGVKGGYYHQEIVTVIMDDEKGSEAMVYVMNNQSGVEPPAKEYLRIIEDGYSHFGFDKKILEQALREAGEVVAKRILFVCHGNICRSPMAEFIMKDIVRRNHCEDKIFTSSAATTDDEIGNDMYPQAKAELKRHGIPFTHRAARRVKHSEYDKWDYIIGMDAENIHGLLYIMGSDPENKIKPLLFFAGEGDREISDPWYTRNFDTAYDDIRRGCEGLVKLLRGELSD